jgi:signal transduction histidine kinase
MIIELKAFNLLVTFFFISQNVLITLLSVVTIILLLLSILLIRKDKNRQNLINRLDDKIRHEQLKVQFKEKEINSINNLIKFQEKEHLKILNSFYADLSKQIDRLKTHIDKVESKTLKNQLSYIDNIVDHNYLRIKHISDAKNYDLLIENGFLEALKMMGEEISNTYGIKVNILEKELNQRLENSKELIIYRIIHELVYNVIQHASATQIDLNIKTKNRILHISVEDNGKGIDPTQTSFSPGVGLKTINRHVENLNGKIAVESRKEKGCRVSIQVPLEQAVKEV